MEQQRIVIEEKDSGIVYQDATTVIMWLPGKGGHSWSNGEWATAVMIYLTPGRNYNTAHFHSNDHADLQACIDDYFGDIPDEE